MRGRGRQRQLRPTGVHKGVDEALRIRLLRADRTDAGAPGRVEPRMRPITPSALAIAVVAGILIALELFRPVHGVGDGARAAIETAIAVSAILTARLIAEVFARSRERRELLLIVAVLALCLADFSLWAGPTLAGVSSPETGGAVRLGCELIGALALAAAAFSRPTSIVEPRRRRAKGAAVLGLAALATLLAQVIAVHTGAGTASAGTASAPGHPISIGVQAVAAAILAVAAFAFVAGPRRTERGAGLIAGASLLLAAAGLQFLAIPALAANWVTPRDGVRLAAYALLLGGACLRYANVRRHDAHAAIRSERERIARDLHDGLAQDLACISMQGQRLDCRLGPEHPLMLATRDALAELRGMIVDLTASTASSSPVKVVRRAELHPAIHFANAAEHGDARHVDVALPRRAGAPVAPVADERHAVSEARPAAVGVRKVHAGGVARLSAEWSLRARRRRPA